MSLNAPKSKRISQHHLESTQSEVHKPIAKPSVESARVVCRRGAVALQMSSQTFTETCAGKLWKTSNLCQVPYAKIFLVMVDGSSLRSDYLVLSFNPAGIQYRTVCNRELYLHSQCYFFYSISNAGISIKMETAHTFTVSEFEHLPCYNRRIL